MNVPLMGKNDFFKKCSSGIIILKQARQDDLSIFVCTHTECYFLSVQQVPLKMLGLSSRNWCFNK